MENQNEGKSKYVWGMLLPIIIIVVLQNIIDIFVTEIIFVYRMGNYESGSYVEFVTSLLEDATSSTVNTLVLLASSAIGVILFGYWYIKHLPKDRVKAPFKGITDSTPAFIIGLVVFSFGLQYVCIYMMNSIAIMRPEWAQEYQELVESAGLGDSTNIAMGIYAVLLAPICEELAFRGVAYKSARKIMPAGWAIFIQAVLFAAYHMNALQSCYTFVVGVALGYLMYRYDNIFVSIFIHMIYNFIGTYISDYLPYGGDSYMEYFAWFLGSLIVAYIGLLLLVKAAPGVKVSEKTSDN